MMMHLYTRKMKSKHIATAATRWKMLSEYPQCPTPINQFRSQNYVYTLKIKPVHGKQIPG